MKITNLALPLAFALGITATPAFADLQLVESKTKTEGFTTITWDAAFQDLDYTCGQDINMTVNWTVDAGAAEFYGFEVKRFTPRSKKDPASGNLISVTQIDNSVTVVFNFNDLHRDKMRMVDIGNAHFKLKLKVDEDGDGILDEVEGFGVNVHVEDPYPYGCP